MSPLVETLTFTLSTKAAQVEVAVGEFDPSRRSPLADGDGAGEPRPRARRLLPAAALVLVVALVVGATLAVRRGDHDTRTAGDDDGVGRDGPGEDGWLVPGWMPDGMDLWSVDWLAPAPVTDRDEFWNTFQLFGDPTAGRALYVQAAPQYEESTAGAEPVTVRGVDGWVGPGVDLQRPVDWIVWTERGATITARFKGMSSEDALAVVEQLDWRSASPADGFAPEGPFELRGEWLGRENGHNAQFLYSEGTPTYDATEDRPAFVVSTTSGGGMPVGYLDAWFYTGGDEASDGARRRYDAAGNLLAAYWPDGRQAQILPLAPDSSVDRPTAERIIASLVVEDEEADLASLRGAVSAHVGALPLLASTEVGVGTLELRGEDGFRRLCLRLVGSQFLDCGDGLGRMGADSPTRTEIVVEGSWEIDGTWYVAAAASGFETRLYGDRGDEPGDDELPATTATVGDWQLLFLQPPADVDEVDILELGGYLGISRPG